MEPWNRGAEGGGRQGAGQGPPLATPLPLPLTLTSDPPGSDRDLARNDGCRVELDR